MDDGNGLKVAGGGTLLLMVWVLSGGVGSVMLLLMVMVLLMVMWLSLWC